MLIKCQLSVNRRVDQGVINFWSKLLIDAHSTVDGFSTPDLKKFFMKGEGVVSRANSFKRKCQAKLEVLEGWVGDGEAAQTRNSVIITPKNQTAVKGQTLWLCWLSRVAIFFGVTHHGISKRGTTCTLTCYKLLWSCSAIVEFDNYYFSVCEWSYPISRNVWIKNVFLFCDAIGIFQQYWTWIVCF